MINLHHLHYFYVCAQTGNVTRAAKKLGISQPSLSAQIKEFERKIGMRLLSRSGRALVLTPKGRELFDYSSKFFEMTYEIERFVRRSETSKSFDIRLGVSSEVERPFVADVLGKLTKTHGTKKIAATIVSGEHGDIEDRLTDAELDVAILNQPVTRARLLAELNIPVLLATTSDETLLRVNNATNVPATLERLGQSLILPMPPLILGQETKDLLKRFDFKGFTSLQSNILACIVRAVEDGIGAAFLPVVYINHQIQKSTLRTVGPRQGYWSHRLYVYSPLEKTNIYAMDVVRIIQDLNALVV